MMMLTVSCASTHEKADPVVVDTSCSWVQLIIISESDILTIDPRTKRAILAHNQKVEANCPENVASGENP